MISVWEFPESGGPPHPSDYIVLIFVRIMGELDIKVCHPISIRVVLIKSVGFS